MATISRCDIIFLLYLLQWIRWRTVQGGTRKLMLTNQVHDLLQLSGYHLNLNPQVNNTPSLGFTIVDKINGNLNVFYTPLISPILVSAF